MPVINILYVHFSIEMALFTCSCPDAMMACDTGYDSGLYAALAGAIGELTGVVPMRTWRQKECLRK